MHWKWKLWLVQNSSAQLLPPFSSLPPVWYPSHERQFSMNFFNMDPYQRLQYSVPHDLPSLKNRLLHCGFPARSAIVPHSCSSLGPFPWGQSFVWASTCSAVGFCTGCSWVSPPPWGTTALSWSVPQAAEESQLWCPEHLLPFSPLTFMSAGLLLSHALTPLSRCSCCCTV